MNESLTDLLSQGYVADLLSQGYVAVSGSGTNAALGDKLSAEGYKVVFLDLSRVSIVVD